MNQRLLRWIDNNTLRLGVTFLIAGLILTVFNVLADRYPFELAEGNRLTWLGIVSLTLRALAYPLVYGGGWLVAAGVLFQHWRVTLVGFEDASSIDLHVEGPDPNNTVWVGKTYGSEFDARLAFDALSKRLQPIPEKSPETAVSGMG